MKFGLEKTTRKRVEPERGLHAICPCCEVELVSKCGNIKIHHWAHKTGYYCDHWWEPETEWHRKWKNRFPKDWQETIKFDPITGEKHIADIFNSKIDLVIEFQNSPIDIQEMQAREKFYKQMLWVVNAENFDFYKSPLGERNLDIDRLEKKLNIEVLKMHTAPYELHEKTLEYQHELYQIDKALSYGTITPEEATFRREKIKDQPKKDLLNFYADGGNEAAMSLKKYHEELGKYKDENETKDLDESYIQYTWTRRRKVWDIATRPVFFDLGNVIVLIKSQFIAKRVPLEKFIKKYGE